MWTTIFISGGVSFIAFLVSFGCYNFNYNQSLSSEIIISLIEIIISLSGM